MSRNTPYLCENCGKPVPSTATGYWKKDEKLEIEYRIQPRNCKPCGARNYTVTLSEEDYEYIAALAKRGIK